MIELSKLEHTWIFDIDGTIVKHNGYKIDGHDSILDGVTEVFNKIPKEDSIILLTARTQDNLETLKTFLKNNNIRYDYLLTNIPMGERILINDRKPSGLNMAYAINKDRDNKLNVNFHINNNL